MTALAALLALLPDPDEARERAERELQNPVYAETEPTLFDRVAQAIGEFFVSLFNPQLGGAVWSPVWTAIFVGLFVVAVIAALVIWGLPRGEHRRSSRSAEVFADDARSAAELRKAADRAQADGQWDDAVVLCFRAIARSLEERGILAVPPGTTARALTERAADFFPDHAEGITRAAGGFDDVRYLRRHASRETAQELADLDAALVRTTPAKRAEAMFA